ncbi:MAG: ketoacyl-ACP synthase III [Saprospiraceae bacterium]
MRNATIISTDAYAPERVLPNSYFDQMLDMDVSSWLEGQAHIYERRWTKDGECTSDLAVKAAEQALKKVGISADQIDLLIIATDTPDYISPSTATVVQHKLGAINAGTFDINSACAGFVTALDIGSKYIKSDSQYNFVLVVGAYNMSKHLNKTDKKTVTLFADGAGAVLLKNENNSERGLLASELISKGQYNEWMGIYAGGTHFPIDETALQNHDHQLKFVRKFPKELNPDTWSAMARNLFSKTNTTGKDIAHYFITQININTIWETMDLIGEPREKAHTIMQHFGYTGSACIPMAFNDAWEKGMVKENDVVFFIGSGGGLAFASAAFRL